MGVMEIVSQDSYRYWQIMYCCVKYQIRGDLTLGSYMIFSTLVEYFTNTIGKQEVKMKKALSRITSKPYNFLYAISFLGALSIPHLPFLVPTSITFSIIMVPTLIGACLEIRHDKKSGACYKKNHYG